MTLIIAAMPAYNEGHAIAEVVRSCTKHVDKVVVIDDGSSDNTSEIAQSLGAFVVRHTKNLGYGAALKSCFNIARELDADVMIVLDSDGQHNPDEIPKLITPLKQGFDLVIGSRFIKDNGKNIPLYRKIGMKVLDIATYLAGGINVTDSQSGFRAYGKKAIEKIRFNGDDMSAGSEILIQVKSHKLKFTEVNIHCRYDIEDCSSQNPFLHGLRVLFCLFMNMFRGPLYYCAVPGILAITIGFFTGFEFLWGFDYKGNLFPASVVFMILSTIIGILLISTGIILHLRSKTIYRS
ncbi:glycosyltransferase family 2 protein [Methanosarcina mazei]|uniref:Glycosyltransferase family 2 protein n=1 Tax=Methanosarcina mazei TaxID=2209 RepID=A0A6C0VN45_METMZ|nr:glycosyltransferase family 2 protein [Methanosarcina mazei]